MAKVLVLDGAQKRAVSGFSGDLFDASGTKLADVVDGLVTARSSITTPFYSAECRLAYSGGNLLLFRYNGCYLTIDGARRLIPYSGVSLAATGLTADTTYYIYAYMSGSSISLAASTTAPAVSSTNGMRVKSDNVAYTLVGMARCVSGPAWSSLVGLVVSYYNRIVQAAVKTLTADYTTTATSLVEVTSAARCGFLTFGQTAVTCFLSLAYTFTCVNGVHASVRVDSATGTLLCGIDGYSFTPTNPNFLTYYSGSLLDAGFYTASLYYSTWGGNGTTTATLGAWISRYTLFFET